MSTALIQQKNPLFNSYKSIISGIEFIEKFMEDPNILNSNSPKLKIFLIQAFSYLHSDFHYLSFLNKEDADSEIIKAAKILQILPVEDTDKLFNNMLDDDIKKFWDKFFSLFKVKQEIECKSNSIFTYSWENKINFFKEVGSTFYYLDYEFSVINVKRLENIDINKEVNNWKEAAEAELNSYHSTSVDFDKKKMTDVNIENFVVDLKQVVSMHQNLTPIKKHFEPENLCFFTNFVHLTKNILQYKKNLSIIYFTNLSEFNHKKLLNEVSLFEALYFIKRCNNFVNAMTSKPY